MSNIAFVLGNGESRKGIQIEDLKKHGTVFACNGVYRTDRPDFLVTVDPKMMIEIAESEYIKNNKVWSNFNVQYNKHQNILDHVKWFQPSLGWSSGPTALRMACDRKHPEIYILGFDLSTYEDTLNNIYKGTDNYLPATSKGFNSINWLNQMKAVFQEFSDKQFYWVDRQDENKFHFDNVKDLTKTDLCDILHII